jgi:hypothetical protein
MMALRLAGAAEVAVARLDRWLETMRGPGGYGGPVVHWWGDCLMFCGAALDWRYEGIIAAYLSLFERTGQARWLGLAQRAGDDLVRGQLPGGHFRNSCFELNPGVGGTPHEAAADVGLLLLARVLRDRGDEGWRVYPEAAERNLTRFYFEQLWDEPEQRFRDDPHRPSFVPNKAATLVEALCLLADLTGRDEILHRYVRPTADAIIDHQVGSSGTPLDGGIAQYSLGRELIGKYFPYYNARCLPGLLAAHERLGDRRYLDAGLRAASFLLRWRDPDGGFPQVIYSNGRVNRYPRWIAAIGDVLRALDLLQPYGFEPDLERTRSWLLGGQLPSGAFRSAEGFGSQVSQRPPSGTPDPRDLLPVVGWNDKALRYLATEVTEVRDDETVLQEGVQRSISAVRCVHRGRPIELWEDDRAIELRRDGGAVYRWLKGTEWAEAAGPWAMLASCQALA